MNGNDRVKLVKPEARRVITVQKLYMIRPGSCTHSFPRKDDVRFLQNQLWMMGAMCMLLETGHTEALNDICDKSSHRYWTVVPLGLLERLHRSLATLGLQSYTGWWIPRRKVGDAKGCRESGWSRGGKLVQLNNSVLAKVSREMELESERKDNFSNPVFHHTKEVKDKPRRGIGVGRYFSSKVLLMDYLEVVRTSNSPRNGFL